MCDPPPIGSWPETHRLGTTVLDTLGSGHTRTKHTSYWTTNRVRYCCVRKHTSTKNSTKANVTIQEKTWTDCQGRPQVSYSSECQGSRHVETLLLAPGLGDCTKCALQIAPDNRTQLADSRAQEKIKSTAPKAGRGRGASSRTVGSEPSGQKWSILLGKKASGQRRNAWIKFCRISLSERRWSRCQNQYVFHSSLLEAKDKNTETPSLE